MKHIVQGHGTKQFQDFFTPPEVAQTMADHLLPQLRAKYQTTGFPVKVLEPSAGSGNLIWPLLSSDVPMEVHCYEIQQWCIDHLISKATELGYHVEITDCTIIRNYDK